MSWQPESPPLLFVPPPETGIFILHFWAVWNYHDRNYDQQLKPLREEFANRIAFRSVNTDVAEFHLFCQECQITNLPALVFFKNGELEATWIGMRPVEEIRQKICELLTDETC